MQPASFRLQRALWSVVNANINHYQHVGPSAAITRLARQFSSCQAQKTTFAVQPSWQKLWAQQRRYKSDSERVQDKIEDAKQKIDDSIEKRVDNVINLPGPEETVKKAEDETIIHTVPESSSIVYNADTPGETAARNTATHAATSHNSDSNDPSSFAPKESIEQSQGSKPRAWDNSSPSTSFSASAASQLPSHLRAQYSRLRSRFNSYMDNVQSHIFIASQRLNDLTGYSAIDELKRSIEHQEHVVRTARKSVATARDSYQAAISTRASTQREVNDLLHRKHAWSPQDLERFTNLYRSDHANEQAEQAAQADLTRAEAEYEEASTKLSKSILARYHEEQVWSDKIRQMSTWGTWGLMGLNVLLFVVFQILVEPWRRRRLVKGFEEKVQEALKEQSAEQELRTIMHINSAKETDRQSTEAVEQSRIVKTTDSDEGTEDTIKFEDMPMEPDTQEMAQRTVIEQAAEAAVAAEIQQSDEAETTETVAQAVDSNEALVSVDTPATSQAELRVDKPVHPPLQPLSEAEYKDLPFLLGSYTRQYLDAATLKVGSMFNEEQQITISRRELTSKMLEGAFTGAVGVICLFWLVGVSGGRSGR